MVTMFPTDSHPDIYRRAPDGSWLRCVWNSAISEYVCFEVDASHVPAGSFALLHPQSDIHGLLPELGERHRS
jgi:hypothetical protein